MPAMHLTSVTRRMGKKDFSPTQVLAAVLQEAYDVLSAADDLSPANASVTEAVNRLEDTIDSATATLSPAQVAEVLGDPSVRAIRAVLLPLLSGSEYARESFFAEKFCEQKVVTQETLGQFWDVSNYESLIQAEVQAIDKSGWRTQAPAREIVFVGSGPLPLTAIFLQARLGCPVVCLDNDAQAIAQSTQLVEKLGLSSSIRFCPIAGEDYDYRNAGLVMVASLANPKESIARRVLETAEDPSTLRLAFRSAAGLNQLMYDPVEKPWLQALGLKITAETEQSPDRINSTLVCSWG